MTGTRLSPAAYQQHLATESARFREVLAGADPGAPVPACPGWSAADLLWHLGGEVQAFWAHVVRTRPRAPGEWTPPARPVGLAPLLEVFDSASADLQALLAEADPAEEAWTWAPEHTVGFTLRRQALEAQVHRLDAEQCVGEVTDLDPALCADGVAETLGVMYGGVPAWGRFDPGDRPVTVRWDLTDTGHRVWTRLGTFTGTDPGTGRSYSEDDVELLDEAPASEPSLVVTGTAAEVHAWLWDRVAGHGLAWTGDPDAERRIRTILDQPLT